MRNAVIESENCAPPRQGVKAHNDETANSDPKKARFGFPPDINDELDRLALQLRVHSMSKHLNLTTHYCKIRSLEVFHDLNLGYLTSKAHIEPLSSCGLFNNNSREHGHRLTDEVAIGK